MFHMYFDFLLWVTSHLLAWRGKDFWSILHPGVEWWIHLLYPWSHLFIYKLCERCNVLPWLMKELKWHHSGHWITSRGKYIVLQTGHRVSNTWVNRLTSMERHLFRELICRCTGCLTAGGRLPTLKSQKTAENTRKEGNSQCWWRLLELFLEENDP